VNIEKKKLYFQQKELLLLVSQLVAVTANTVSDPNKPVPYTMDIEGSFQITPRNYMSEDQRFCRQANRCIGF
jgi:hypothetical protein